MLARVERMGRRGREVVVREYDLRVAGRRLLEVYREVAAHFREDAA